jgi:hypothetical protein
MDGVKPELQPNVMQFPMKHPEIQISYPEHTMLPDEPRDQEYAQNTQTWE